MSQNFRFAAAKIRLFPIPTIFFRQNFSNILYLIDNQQGNFFLYLKEILYGNLFFLTFAQILNFKS